MIWVLMVTCTGLGVTGLSYFFLGGIPFPYVLEHNCTALSTACSRSFELGAFGLDFIFWLIIQAIFILVVKILIFRVRRDNVTPLSQVNQKSQN
jgi:hypothetical protein